MNINRNRLIYLLLIILTIFVGLGSRTSIIPKFIYPYLGDYFYTVMFFLIIGFISNRMTTLKVAIISVLLCYAIEALQLYKADWIMDIRKNRIGGLILGHGFLWSDMISYTLGGLTCYFVENSVHQRRIKKGRTTVK